MEPNISPDVLGFLFLERGLKLLKSSGFSGTGCYYERPDFTLAQQCGPIHHES